ncbi:MAG: hypothetical protein IT368_07620 [Candidatus Hydrogenedentes bacterium]|nr:hypothetical protein [Candidatus Hydrogenedentota bacterium]
MFGPGLRWIFAPTNSLFEPIHQPWWKVAAVSLFLLTMVGVFLLRKEYVNLDAPRKGLLFDLRLWTIVSMLPHVLIYLYF